MLDIYCVHNIVPIYKKTKEWLKTDMDGVDGSLPCGRDGTGRE